MEMTARNMARSMATLLLALFLTFCLSRPAYADEYVPPEQTSAPVNIALTSDDEKLAGCHYKAYKLMSATFTGPFADSHSLIYAPGVDTGFILPDNPTAAIANVEGSIELDSKGDSDLEWDYLRGLADRAASTLPPVADLVVDTGTFALPGTGYYLFVMDGYQNIDSHDDNITAPFFTTPIEEDEDIEILVKRNEGTDPDPFWLANMVQGREEPSKRATLTAIYQPDNIPEDVRIAAEMAEQEQKEAMEKEIQGDGLAFSFLPIIFVVGGVVALNVIMKTRKKMSKRNAAPKGKPAENTRKEVPQPTEETPAVGDDVKVLSGSRPGD